jgi:putative membrane protein
VTTEGTTPANALAAERTHLAARRTLMAADRSLMAWIRTALSMISFGFTIYKLLQGFVASGAQLARANSPREMGLFLTGLGTIAMVMGTIEYWQTLKELRRLEHFRLWRPSFAIALIMSATGLFLFVGIIRRLL